jgi:prephenate dehydrogenase
METCVTLGMLKEGQAEALAEARALFAVTMVEQRVMSLDDHDRVMAFVLGLSHAVNIAFFTALARSGETAPRLAELSSTTFDSQLEVAKMIEAAAAAAGTRMRRFSVSPSTGSGTAT